MEYRVLGRTGVEVSVVCLGASMFGAEGNPDRNETIGIVHRALDAGVNFIDTADVHSQGESEEIVGQAIRGRRDEVVLATKFYGPMGSGPNRSGTSRRWIFQAVEMSLRRLQTDWIDVYQPHRLEPNTDLDETLGALSDLVHAGKVRYLGSSTFPAHESVEAQWVAERRGRERFVCEQSPYSLLTRGIERDVIPACQRHGVGVLAYSPLGGGWLGGRYRKGREVPRSSRADLFEAGPTRPEFARVQRPDPRRFDLSLPENQRKLDAADALATLADEAGLTLVHLALAFVLEHPGVDSAIVGPRTPEHLEGQLGAENVRLPADVLDRIDEIVPPGTNLNPNDANYTPAELSQPALRRRR